MTQSGYYLTDEPSGADDAPDETLPTFEAPCPCCAGAGHAGRAGGASCYTAVDLSLARLSLILGRPLPLGWSVAGVLSHEGDPRAEDLTVSCLRCFDAGVVPEAGA